MPRNRSDKCPHLEWFDPEAVKAYALAIKDAEAIGLVGPWFNGDDDREFTDELRDADAIASDKMYALCEEDSSQIRRLCNHMPSSNDRNIAIANLILRSMKRAEKSK